MKLFSSKNIITTSAYLFFFIVGALYFPSSGRDDSHITYWAAYSLAEFGSLLNYNGEAVEQSSSLMHVFVIAVISKLVAINIVSIGYIISIICGFISVHVITKYMMDKDQKEHSIFVFLPWLICTLSSFIYWSFGGLESTLAAFIFTLFIIFFNDYIEFGGIGKLTRLSLIMLMFLTIRPETVIVLLCLLISLFFVINFRSKPFIKNSLINIRILHIGTISVSVSIAIFIARYLYTGMFFPLPALAKSGSHDLSRLMEGFSYFGDSIITTNSISIFLLAVIMILVSISSILFKQYSNKFSLFTILISLFVLIYIAFIITSGGDWMESGRFFVPILPMVAVLAISLLDKLKNKRVAIFIVMAVITIQGYSMFEINRATSFHLEDYEEISQYELPNSYSFFEAMNRVHLRDIPLSYNLNAIIETVKNNNGSEIVTFMSPYAGMVAFHAIKKHFGEARFIDMYGLSTLDMYNCRFAQDSLSSNEGIKVTFEYFFKYSSDFKSKCGIEFPDIIFSSSLDKQLKGQPYTIIYSQEVNKDYSGTFSKNQLPLRSRMQIAVNDKYLKLFESTSIWYW